ncbi:MAG: ATP-dependent RNA helicase dbp7, partial [Bogoriella megaspora]
QGRRDGGLGVARHTADELLQKGFGDPTKGANQKSREWEDAATEWQLNVERWVQDSTKNLEMARRAFQSHVRAYATHIAAERQIFNIKELHLGHLAKAFALRDKPGSIRVPGLRPGKDESAKTKAERRAKVGLKGSEDGPMQGKDRKDSAANAIETSRPTDAQEAARKMREKMKQMAGVSEFNIG